MTFYYLLPLCIDSCEVFTITDSFNDRLQNQCADDESVGGSDLLRIASSKRASQRFC
jgi:hypothetical protein